AVKYSMGLLLPCFVPVLALLMAPLQCVLMGFWINSQGSNMTIDLMNDKGKFSSLYHNTVTATKNEIKISLLQESQHPKNKVNQPTFGFIINWSFSDSTTVFMGQCFVDRDGKEILRTTWLLRQEVSNLEEDWKVTR
ncbi:AVID protein, partial [Crypturellus undulatus]|nr:AVID protein [Crypturellus undulatus]